MSKLDLIETMGAEGTREEKAREKRGLAMTCANGEWNFMSGHQDRSLFA